MIKIGKKIIGEGQPVYVIAEVGSNFDGSLSRAKALAKLAKECGADAFKIQNFKAPQIVSQAGFENLKVGFQSQWDKSVIEVYKQAEFPRAWLKELSAYCGEIGIDFFSAPYDKEAVALLEQIRVPAYKIGSGEIDNLKFLSYVAEKQKPMLIGTGAADLEEIERAVKTIKEAGNEQIVLLQCVTNYPSPIADANLKAMLILKEKFDVVVGYSDHSIGKAGGGDDPLDGLTVPLAAAALGAKVIEKHFTDDRTRSGPDHPFALEPALFKKMILGIRAVEKALGSGQKKVMPSEKETIIIQRRGIYAKEDIRSGEIIKESALTLLRPAIGLRPAQLKVIIGKKAKREIKRGEPIKENDISF